MEAGTAIGARSAAGEPPPPRLASLDALRGFDMLWITGGRTVVNALAAATGAPLVLALGRQLEHTPWNGFTAWDLVFPLFLFLSGVTIPFSQDRKLAAGTPRGLLARRIVRRALLLVVLGAIYNGLLTFDLAHQRWASVLARIGLGWAGAATIALFTGWRGRALAAVAILLLYAALLGYWPVPDGAGTWIQGHNVVDLFDQRFLPGRLHKGNHDPEGILSTIPAVATALLGTLAGARLRRVGRPRARTVLELACAGLVLLLCGWGWGRFQPINKNLWTSSFVLWTGGWSLLLLALFHGLVDVLGWRKAAFPLVVLGANPITLYLLDHFVAFDAVSAFLLQHEPVLVDATVVALVAVGMRWLVLWALWRRRIFLRV